MQRKDDVLYGVLDSNTGEWFTYRKVTTWVDGSPMTPEKCDRIIHIDPIEYPGEYFRREFAGAVNAAWFGIQGDGTIDDTTQLQLALTVSSLNRLPVYLPKTSSHYRITAPLIYDGGNIISNGAVIKAATNTFHILTVTGTNIVVENLDLEYLTAQTVAQSLGWCPILIDGSNIIVRNVNVKNGGSFYVTGSDNILIDKCSLIGTHYQGFFVHTSTGVTVTNCYAEKTGTAYRSEQSFDVLFSNNYGYDIWNNGIRIEDTQRAKVIGNTIKRAYGGIMLYGPTIGLDTRDIVVANNILEDCYYPVTEVDTTTPIILPNILYGAMNSKSHLNNVIWSNNIVRNTAEVEVIYTPTTESTVFTFPGWNTSEVRTDTAGTSNLLVERYSNYIFVVDTDPVSVSNRRVGSWYYVNLAAPVDLNNTHFTIDIYVPTTTLVPGQFEVRLYSGVDRTGLIGAITMYNAGIANTPLSVIFNTAGLSASSVRCIELYCLLDELSTPVRTTPSGIYMGQIRKGLSTRVGYWHSFLNNQPTNINFSNSNIFENVEIPVLHKRLDADDALLNYIDRIDDRGPQAGRPLNVPDGYRYFNTDTEQLEIKSGSEWISWVAGDWTTWPDAPTLNDVLVQGNSSSQPIILTNQSFRAGGSSTSNGYSWYDANGIRWLLGKLGAGTDLTLSRYDVTNTLVERCIVISNSTGRVGIGSNLSSAISTLDVRGSLTVNYVSVSVDTTLGETHFAVSVSTTASAITITLPAAAACFGRIYVIKKSTSDANVVTIDGDGAELIDGAATISLPAINDTVILQSTGTTFNIIAQRIDATTTTRGLISTGTQSFAGSKTFSGTLSAASFQATIVTNNLYIPTFSSITAITNAIYLFAAATTVYIRSALGGGSTAGILTAGSAYTSTIIGRGVVTEASSGNHPLIAGLVVTPPTVTGAGATVTLAATLYIESAPTVAGGTPNWALYIAAGDASLQNLFITAATYSTGGYAPVVRNTTTGRLETITAGSNVVEVTGTSQAATVNMEYFANNASLVTITLPVSAIMGDKVHIRGKGTGGWKLGQNAGQIIYGATNTTTGTGGSVASSAQYNTVTVECMDSSGTSWIIIASQGTLTIT